MDDRFGLTSPRRIPTVQLLTRILPWLMFAFGLTVTYYLQDIATRDAKQLLQNQFNAQTHDIVNRIEQRMATYEQVLRGVNGLFAASTRVDRDEFRNYVAHLYLEEHYPGIQGVGFSLIIPPKDKTQHIRSMNRQGLTDYGIRPTGKRDFYTSIVYLEPNYGRNLWAIGYDMYSEAVRREAMARARDSGRAVMSGKVTLVQEIDGQTQAGFLMYLPVYRKGSVHDSAQTRCDNIVGWVYSPFRMDDLMSGVLGRAITDFDLMIFDGEIESKEALMYDIDSSIKKGLPDDSLFRMSQRLNIADHSWILNIRSLPVFEDRLDMRETRLIQKVGILLSMVLAALIWLLVNGRARLVNIAARMTRELRESEAFNISVLDSLREHIAVLDTQGFIIAVNEAWRRFDRANHGADALMYSLGLNYFDVCRTDGCSFGGESQAAMKGISAVLEGHLESFSMEYPCHTANEQRWFQMHVRPLQGPRSGAVVAHENITARRMNEEALRLAGTVFNSVGEAVMVTDHNNTIIAVNPAFTMVTGFSSEDVIGKNPNVLSSGEHAKPFYQAFWYELMQTDRWSGEITNRRKDGKRFIEWLSIKIVRDNSGAIRQYVGVFTDISERKANEERIYHLAHYDVLTDLPNRALLTDRLNQALAKARRGQTMLAVLFIDLDKFKPVNDNLGHNIGDILLKEVGARLQTCMQRKSDTVSRLGGDEFVALLAHVDKASDAVSVAEKILAALSSQDFDISGNRISISASVGIAIYPQHGEDIKKLMKNADTAMYHAKKAGRNAYRLFDHPMDFETD